MSSKYDAYWQSKLVEIRRLLEEALKFGKSSEIDVSDLESYGNRESWYGVVELTKNRIERGEMAHAKSLGKVILKSKILDSYGNTKFRLIISGNLELMVESLANTKELLAHPKSEEKDITDAGEKSTNIRKQKLAEILAKIPWEKWELIVRQEPEWELMEPFLDRYGFGPFAVLMTVLGLNDYQLKGKVEEVYWPVIHKLLEVSPTPESPVRLFNLLTRFYEKERLPTAKIERLNRFLYSNLASKLWESPSHNVSLEFINIWKALARVMNQNPEVKTICFAMKCLGISLLMVEDYRFDFTKIPIPVDSRIKKFTHVTEICLNDNDEDIRSAWHDILSLLRKDHPNITMMHLDSLVWQIASLRGMELQRYFESLGLTRVGRNLTYHLGEFLFDNQKRENPIKKELARPLEFNELSRRNILILFPCSKSKQSFVSRETFSLDEERKVEDFILSTKENLISGRKGKSYCIDKNSKLGASLDRYNGYLYNVDKFRQSVRKAYLEKDVHILIMSGAYGILTPDERIHLYGEPMKSMYWIRHGLPEVIEEYIEKNKITDVFGFFSFSSGYMEIMMSIDWQKLKKSPSLEVARTYYVNLGGAGGAQVKVPKTTGNLIVSFIESNFNPDNFYRSPFHGHHIESIDHLA